MFDVFVRFSPPTNAIALFLMISVLGGCPEETTSPENGDVQDVIQGNDGGTDTSPDDDGTPED